MKIKLTQALVNKYQIPPDLDVKQQELVDEGGTGLYLLVLNSGMKTYYLRYRSALNGNKTTHIKLGRAGDITLERVRHSVKLYRAEIAEGGDPQDKVKHKRNEMTYGTFMEDYYFPYIMPLRRNAKKYRELYDNKIKPVFGDIKINAITRRQVQTFHSDLKQQGYSNAYSNRHLQLIKSSINVGFNIMQVFDIKNPAVGIPLMEEAPRDRHLSQDELYKLMPVLHNAEGHLVVPARIIRFLLATGLRLGECFHCRWEDIDLENRVMVIPASHAKSKRLDSIPLNPAAIQVLEECGRISPYPFGNPATEGKAYVSIKRSFKTLLVDKAGIEGITAHCLRRTAASLMINSGRSLIEVMKFLRNSSPLVTERHYTRLNSRNLAEASDTISEQLLRAASGEKL